MQPDYTEEFLNSILKNAKTIAMVGASDNPKRYSYEVLEFLLRQGYDVIPINPKLAGCEVHGKPVLASLGESNRPIDIVYIFRHPDHVPEAVNQAVEVGAKAVWMQLGVSHEEACRKAQAAGLDVVMDRCMKIELSCINS